MAVATKKAPARKPARQRIVVLDDEFDGGLGNLVTYTMPDDPLPLAKVLMTFAQHGLDTSFLPKQRSQTHVFQAAARSVDTRRGGNGRDVEINVDQVQNDAATIAYQITRQVLDRKDRMIRHTAAMTVGFAKSTSVITVTAIDADAYDALRELEVRIRDHFDANQTTIPGPKLRNAIRALIESQLGAQNLRGKAGGLYFVPPTYRDVDPHGHEVEHECEPILDALRDALVELDPRADVMTFPCVNDERRRQQISRRAHGNLADRTEELTVKAINRLRAGKGERGVRGDFMANCWNERRKLVLAMSQFEELVGLEVGTMHERVQELDRVLGELEDLRDSD